MRRNFIGIILLQRTMKGLFVYCRNFSGHIIHQKNTNEKTF